MKAIPKKRDDATATAVADAGGQVGLPPWKLLVVDDEPDVHQLTRMSLSGFRYGGRALEVKDAYSAQEAKDLLRDHPDMAVALVDVVMEDEDAGLRLVEHVRRGLGMANLRLLIRTGQPGVAPERFVIDHYDIDGYHDKTALSAQRLYTAVRSAIKAYRDLHTIDVNRQGLGRVLRSTRDLYQVRGASLREFLTGVLTQIVGLFRLGENGLISTVEGMVLALDDRGASLQAGIGAFGPEHAHEPAIRRLVATCSRAVQENVPPRGLREDALLLPLRVEGRPVGFVYLEHTGELGGEDRGLLQVMANQCAGALENLRLHLELEASYDQVVEMLALASEYRDSTTGEHINRIARLTSLVALEMGCPAREAEAIGKAARLHDVGKVGIPDRILRKPGALDPGERGVVERHARIGADILGRDRKLALARQIALMHHERWGGGGYPDGVSGDHIPLAARILSVVDVFDALVNARPYKPAWSPARALDYIDRERAQRFDPDVVEAFRRVLGREYPSESG